MSFNTARLANIRAVISDVDGVLTDGGITLGNDLVSIRTFHTHDGLGHDLLHKAGFVIGWLSATGSPESVRRRAEQLKVKFVDAGPGEKLPRFHAMCSAMGVTPDQVAYIGDDVNDIACITAAGIGACPADARPQVRQAASLVLQTIGGRGCFRELADMLLAR